MSQQNLPARANISVYSSLFISNYDQNMLLIHHEKRDAHDLAGEYVLIAYGTYHEILKLTKHILGGYQLESNNISHSRNTLMLFESVPLTERNFI